MSTLADRLARRIKRAAHRREPRSYIEVTAVTRCTPTSWVATVVYSYRRGVWEERVRFTRTRSTGHDLITVIDEDYPADRKRAFVAAHGSDMASVIVSYLIAGRW